MTKRVRYLGIISLLIFTSVDVRSQSSHKSKSNGASASVTKSSDEELYHPSDQIFTPVELRTSIYKYKGQSGILDTYVLYWGSNEYLGGQKFGRWLTPTLRLARMIDEHTAIYDILMLQRGAGPGPEGEIAVRLPDSDPPDPKRYWRVLVLGVLVGENGIGGTVEVPAVRFEGYTEEPQKVGADNIHPQTDAGTVSTRSPSMRDDDLLKVASYRQKCNGGDTQDCINLATMYRMGWGVVKDQSEANSLYKKACDAGSDDACSHFDPAIPPPASPAPATSRIGTKQPATIMPKPTSDPPSPQLPH